MKIQILADLHMEFFPLPRRRAFLEGLQTDCDVVALAGDVGTIEELAPTLEWFCDHYPQVVYVTGNHELYRSSFEAVRELLGSLDGRLDNLHFLDNRAVTIGGQRFLGTTLWFPNAPQNDTFAVMLNDFILIEGFQDRVYVEAARASEFLRETLQPGDVVLTHHLPSHRSVHAEYKDSPLTRFFVFPQDDLIESRLPALWVHGHTHLSCDYRLGPYEETRVLCNPYGYYRHEENPRFDPYLMVDLQREGGLSRPGVRPESGG